MGHALAEQCFGSYDDSYFFHKNDSMSGSHQKGKNFTDVMFTNCRPKDGKNVWRAMEHTFNEAFFNILSNSRVFLKIAFHTCTFGT